MTDSGMLVFTIITLGLLAFVLGWTMGYMSGSDDRQKLAEDTAKQIQKAYNNGIRVGGRRMLDSLVHQGTITEGQAALIDAGWKEKGTP